MASKIRPFFDRHWSFVITDTRMIFPALTAVFVLSVYLSLFRGDWQLIGRFGNLVILAGAVVSLRRLFRLGDQSVNEKLEPWTLPPEYPGAKGVQFNIARANQQVFAAGDARAQAVGFVLILVGTFVASYGDLLLDWLVPLS